MEEKQLGDGVSTCTCSSGDGGLFCLGCCRFILCEYSCQLFNGGTTWERTIREPTNSNRPRKMVSGVDAAMRKRGRRALGGRFVSHEREPDFES